MQRSVITHVLAVTMLFNVIAKAQQMPVVTLLSKQTRFVIGEPINIKYSIKTNRSGYQYINALNIGQLSIGLFDNNNKPVQLKARREDHSSGIIGERGLPDHRYFIHTDEGEYLLMSIELTDYYELNIPGRYILKYLYNDGDPNNKNIISELPISINDVKDKSSLLLSGNCLDSDNMRNMNYLNSDKFEVKCSINISEVLDKESTLWVAQISNLNVNGRDCERRYGVLYIPSNTIIEQADIDYRWQVWVKLVSGTKQSLILWNLLDGTVKTLVPFSKDKIKMNVTLYTIDRSGKVIIAGVDNNPLHTTWSIP